MVRVERNNDANWKFPVPVFFLIATKLRVPLPSPVSLVFIIPGTAFTWVVSFCHLNRTVFYDIMGYIICKKDRIVYCIDIHI